MTFSPDTRVARRSRPSQHGTAQTLRGLDHRTLVAWDDRPGLVQFVDDDELAPVEAEQGALDL